MYLTYVTRGTKKLPLQQRQRRLWATRFKLIALIPFRSIRQMLLLSFWR